MYNKPVNKLQLREWRLRHSCTQRELAELLGVSKDAVTSWELGRRAIPSYLHLALNDLERTKLREK